MSSSSLSPSQGVTPLTPCACHFWVPHPATPRYHNPLTPLTPPLPPMRHGLLAQVPPLLTPLTPLTPP